MSGSTECKRRPAVPLGSRTKLSLSMLGRSAWPRGIFRGLPRGAWARNTWGVPRTGAGPVNIDLGLRPIGPVNLGPTARPCGPIRARAAGAADRRRRARTKHMPNRPPKRVAKRPGPKRLAAPVFGPRKLKTPKQVNYVEPHKSPTKVSPKARLFSYGTRRASVKPTSMRLVVPTGDRQACLREFRRAEYINRGAWSQVFVACRGRDCKYAAKITLVATPHDLSVAKRDEYFLRKLAHVRLDGERIVPEFVDAWMCSRAACQAQDVCPDDMKPDDTGIYVLVTALYDRENLYDRVLRQATEAGLRRGHEEIALYERRELLRVYRLMAKLASQGCIVSDSKPDNMLVRGDLIVATDFGFWGEVGRAPAYVAASGWNSNQKNPPAFRVCPDIKRIDFIRTETVALLFNLWQFESYLVASGRETPTFVRDDDGTIYRFVGIDGFAAKLDALRPRSFDSLFCPRFTEFYRRTTDAWKRMRDYPTMSFSWKQVTDNL